MDMPLCAVPLIFVYFWKPFALFQILMLVNLQKNELLQIYFVYVRKYLHWTGEAEAKGLHIAHELHGAGKSKMVTFL